MTEKITAYLRAMLSYGEELYAIVDTGINKEFLNFVKFEEQERVRILLKEPYLHGYEDVAPYLISLFPDEPLFKKLLQDSQGGDWLTLIASKKSLDDLAERLRDMIVPYSQVHQKHIIYRFYDQRNLRNYILIHDENEICEFYDDIGGSLFSIDHNDRDILHIYSIDGMEFVDLRGEE